MKSKQCLVWGVVMGATALLSCTGYAQSAMPEGSASIVGRTGDSAEEYLADVIAPVLPLGEGVVLGDIRGSGLDIS